MRCKRTTIMTNGRDKWEGNIDATLEAIKETQKEIKDLLRCHLDKCSGLMRESDCRIDKLENKVTEIEVRSGILGTIGGIMAAVIGWFIQK
jgi:hypothetical protein